MKPESGTSTCGGQVQLTHPGVTTVNRIVVFPGPGQVQLIAQDMPVLEPGHILCRTIFSGISNGTERNHLLGGNYGRRFPTGIGYQKVAQVIAVGDGVACYREGDIIFSGTCGKHAAFFTENVVEPDAQRNLVVPLPQGMEPMEAALLGVGSVAMHDVRRAAVQAWERVLVVGAGLIGQFTAQCAMAAGAHVTVCNRGADRLDVARRLGVHETVQVSAAQAWADVRQRGPFDVVFETSGGDVLDQIIGRTDGPPSGMLRAGGRLVLIGGRFDVTFDSNVAQFQELTILLAAHFRRSDLLDLLELVGEGHVRIGPLVQDVIPIDEAALAYRRLRNQPQTMLGTVFAWK